MDLFHVLGNGAKFNKKRFNDDVTLFEACQKYYLIIFLWLFKRNKSINYYLRLIFWQAQKINQNKKIEQDSSLFQEIDFFHNDENSIAETLGKIQIEKNTDISIEEDDDDSENNGKKNKINCLNISSVFIIFLLLIWYFLKEDGDSYVEEEESSSEEQPITFDNVKNIDFLRICDFNQIS
jgi:hypothetical protein